MFDRTTSGCFTAPRLFTGEHFIDNAWLTIERGIIVAIGQDQPPKPAIALTGTLVPGFIDIQVNGGGGALFNAEPTIQTIESIALAHRQFGTTGFLPTLITDSFSVLQQGADAVAQAIKANAFGVLGVHFEGPHLSVAKKGVHSEQFIRPLTDAEQAIYCRKDLGKVVLTVAPENVSPSQISELVQEGVIVCLGHSNASFNQTEQALAAGARGFTHLFNAMSAFTSREPGMVGAALLDANSWCGLIVDGHHVDYASLQLAIKAKGTEKMLLVTDAMPPVGTDDQHFDLNGRTITRHGDKLTAPTGELAGSVLDMRRAIGNAITHLHLNEAEALKMASRYPAEFLGIHNKGMLKVGLPADVVVMGCDGVVD